VNVSFDVDLDVVLDLDFDGDFDLNVVSTFDQRTRAGST